MNLCSWLFRFVLIILRLGAEFRERFLQGYFLSVLIQVRDLFTDVHFQQVSVILFHDIFVCTCCSNMRNGNNSYHCLCLLMSTIESYWLPLCTITAKILKYKCASIQILTTTKLNLIALLWTMLCRCCSTPVHSVCDNKNVTHFHNQLIEYGSLGSGFPLWRSSLQWKQCPLTKKSHNMTVRL